MKILLNFLFFRAKRSSFFSLPPQGSLSSTLIIFLGPYCLYMSFFFCGTRAEHQLPRCGLTSAEQSRMVIIEWLGLKDTFKMFLVPTHLFPSSIYTRNAPTDAAQGLICPFVFAAAVQYYLVWGVFSTRTSWPLAAWLLLSHTDPSLPWIFGLFALFCPRG